MSYYDRLIWLGADSLAARRLKFDLAIFYDIIHDNINVDLPRLDIVDPKVIHTRGHSFRIIMQQCRINARVNSFACRNVNVWNSLPENVVWCQSRATFKRYIDILVFQSVCQGNASVGTKSHLWPSFPFKIITLYILFLLYVC